MPTRFLRIESYRKGIIFSLLFSIFSRSIGFVTSLVISFYFGTRADADVYFYCVSTIALVTGFLSALNSAVIIPESMRLEHQHGREKSREFVNFFLYMYLALGIALSITVAANPVKSLLLLSRFDYDTLNANAAIIYFVIPLFTLNLVSVYLIDVLTSHRFFTMPMISNIVLNCCAIAGAVFLRGTFGISSVLIGLIAGNALQILLLAYLLKNYAGWHFRFKFVLPERSVLRNVLSAKAGNSSNLFSSYLPLFLLSGLGQGTISGLNYGRQVSEIPNLLATNQFASVLGIKLNELHAAKNLKRMDEIFRMSCKFLIFLLTPAALLLVIYSREIISILFQRGSFNADSVDTSARFLEFFALLLPLAAINSAFARVNMAAQKLGSAAFYQTLFNILIMIFVFAGIKLFGPAGYPLALVAANAVNMLGLYLFARKIFPWLGYLDVLKYLGRILALNIALSPIIALLKYALAPAPEILNLAAGALAYAAILLALNHRFDLNGDISMFWRGFSARLNRAAGTKSNA